MIRFDDQPPMSPAADEWANSALEKSEKYIDKKISNLFYKISYIPKYFKNQT